MPNFKNILSISILFIGGILISISFTYFFLREKTAYVDTSALMAKLDMVKKLNSDIENMKKSSQARIDTLQTEFETALKKYEKELTKMSAKEKQLSRELLQVKQRQVSEYEQAVKRKNYDEQQRMTQTVLEKVNTSITEYGKTKGYDMIFGTNGGNIIYGTKGKDISDEIIEIINKRSN